MWHSSVKENEANQKRKTLGARVANTTKKYSGKVIGNGVVPIER